MAKDTSRYNYKLVILFNVEACSSNWSYNDQFILSILESVAYNPKDIFFGMGTDVVYLANKQVFEFRELLDNARVTIPYRENTIYFIISRDHVKFTTRQDLKNIYVIAGESIYDKNSALQYKRVLPSLEYYKPLPILVGLSNTLTNWFPNFFDSDKINNNFIFQLHDNALSLEFKLKEAIQTALGLVRNLKDTISKDRGCGVCCILYNSIIEDILDPKIVAKIPSLSKEINSIAEYFKVVISKFKFKSKVLQNRIEYILNNYTNMEKHAYWYDSIPVKIYAYTRLLTYGDIPGIEVEYKKDIIIVTVEKEKCDYDDNLRELSLIADVVVKKARIGDTRIVVSTTKDKFKEVSTILTSIVAKEDNVKDINYNILDERI